MVSLNLCILLFMTGMFGWLVVLSLCLLVSLFVCFLILM